MPKSDIGKIEKNESKALPQELPVSGEVDTITVEGPAIVKYTYYESSNAIDIHIYPQGKSASSP